MATHLSAAEARERILASLEPLATTVQSPLRAALGEVLAQDLVSPCQVPPHANSAMDGYALRAADTAGQTDPVELRLVGTSWAGKPYQGTLGQGECVRIMTGAMLPVGADSVVMQERAQRDGERVRVPGAVPLRDNVREAGEDIDSGQIVLRRGRRLLPADLGLLASLGIAEVKLYRRLRVALISTGDELRSLGQTLEPGQIYDSNRYTLHAALQRAGADLLDLGVIPDQPAAIENAFRAASAAADLVITSGGVSVGDADYVTDTLRQLGRVDFWKIAIKPGHPLAFGQLGPAVFFGLPGNPVSALVTFYQFVLPALRRLQGETEAPLLRLRARCTQPIRRKPGRQEFQRGVLSHGADGELDVCPSGAQSSGVLSSMSQANCFIVLPADCGAVAAGDSVSVELFAGLV